MSADNGGNQDLQEGCLQQFLEILPLAAYVCNAEGVITAFNRTAESILGYRPVAGEKIQFLTAFGDPMSPDEYATAIASKTDREYLGQELIVRQPNGEQIDVLLCAKPLHDAESLVSGAIGILVDIRVQKKARRLLQNQVKEYRRVEQRIHESNDREQCRLVNYLHEDLAQQLTGMALLIGVLQRHIGIDCRNVAPKVSDLSRMVSECISAARHLAKGVYPLDLGDSGLMASLEYLAERTEAKFRVPCELSHGNRLHYEEAEALHLYRIVQGIIRGVIKHASPSKIEIDCQTAKGRSKIAVRYLCERTKSRQAMEPVLDLDLLNSRARLIGASIEIQEEETGGEVSCWLNDSGCETA